VPKVVAKPPKDKDADAWNEDEVALFLATTTEHRWAVAFRLVVLYGLRRSELLALRWDDVDDEAKMIRIDEGVVATAKGAAWSDAKNERSRRRIPVDDQTFAVLETRRDERALERAAAGPAWQDNGLIIATRDGKLVLPLSYDRALTLQIEAAGLRSLTSHRLRHTAEAIAHMSPAHVEGYQPVRDAAL